MPDPKRIKLDILNYIKRSDINFDDITIENVSKELSVLETTEGINDVNNLEHFYEIWQENKNKTGTKNHINSWTAYCLGITSKKPDGEFLPSRRAFARAGFPDIDTDFDDEGRDLIYDYIIKKYGRENVGNIGTHGMLKLKSCVRRVGKALDVANAYSKGKDAYITENENKVTEILSALPKTSTIKVKDDSGEVHTVKTLDDAIKHFPDFEIYMKKFPELVKHARHIEGTFANFAAHPAGLVISNEPLERLAPLRTSRMGLATQYSYEDLEEIGLIKFDILAISTLTVIKKCIKLVKENYNIDIDLHHLPLDDDAVFKIFREGNLAGIFQCEEYGMQETLKKIGVDRFYDIMAAIALYRPGPMDNISSYCERKKGNEKIDYFHKSIEKYVKPILEESFGILIFQENLMQICNVLAGFSIADGYVMIKAVGKKKKKLLDKFEKQFVDGCVKNNVPEKIAQKYWNKFITPFASYGFNLSHSGAYSLLSYFSGYLKSHFPEEFIICTLNVESERAHHEKVEKYENEFARKMLIKFLPRKINHSRFKYILERKRNSKEGIEKSEIRPSLLCKGLGVNSAKHIEKKQPFKNIKELAEKTNPSLVDARAVLALAENGYLGKKRSPEDLVKEFNIIRQDLKKAQKRGVDTMDLFSKF